jgi:hypothetical protein
MLGHALGEAKAQAEFIVEVFLALHPLYTSALLLGYFCNSHERSQNVFFSYFYPKPLFCPVPAYFAYYRVSTQKQGNSGLGLEAQRAAVKNFLQGTAPVGEYVEVESGKKNQRPQLLAAIAAARAAVPKILFA